MCVCVIRQCVFTPTQVQIAAETGSRMFNPSLKKKEESLTGSVAPDCRVCATAVYPDVSDS